MADLRFFPYAPRKYQEKIIEMIQREIEGNKNICIHAPSGFGKTVTILAALLPFVEEGARILWACKTGNQTDRPIEELKVINKKCLSGFFGLSFRGKLDMCLLAREYGKDLSYEDVNYICAHKKDECKFIRNFKYVEVLDEINEPISFTEMLKICKSKKVCPYKLQCELANRADIISMSYNYVFQGNDLLESERPTILVVDESHNLQHINMNSYIITYNTIKRALIEVDDFNLGPELRAWLSEFLSYMEKIMNIVVDEYKIDKKEICELCNVDILEKLRAAGLEVRAARLSAGKVPRSAIHRIYLFFNMLFSTLDQDGIALIASRNRNENIQIEIFDMRASELFRDKWDLFNARIFCSGTLEPIEAFAEISGLDKYASCRIPSIYTSKNILPIITNGLTTKGLEIPKEMTEKYIKNICDFVSVVSNALVFTSSYRVQESLLEHDLADKIKDKNLFIETSEMRGEEGKKIIKSFNEGEGNVLIAPIGGRFSEGIDCPGRINGIYIVGIPFDKVCAKTNAYLNYYINIYGQARGRLYGYILPAMKRAAQAIGRGLRDEKDRCVVVLGDERYSTQKLFKLLPDYVRENALITYPKSVQRLAEKFNTAADFNR